MFINIHFNFVDAATFVYVNIFVRSFSKIDDVKMVGPIIVIITTFILIVIIVIIIPMNDKNNNDNNNNNYNNR